MFEEGAIQLLGGSNENEGFLEMFLLGYWLPICDYSWDILDATVACHQLGYSAALSVHARTSFEPEHNWIRLEGLQCTGYELNLTQCGNQTVRGGRCSYNKRARVTCSGKHYSMPYPRYCISNNTMLFTYIYIYNFAHSNGLPCCVVSFIQYMTVSRFHCSTFELESEEVGKARLVGGRSANDGLVQLYLFGHWGTVCGDSWDLMDAVVVCRQMGYSTALTALSNTVFEDNGALVWPILSNCNGYEANLTQCGNRTVASCSSSSKAGVVCSSENTYLQHTCTCMQFAFMYTV